MVATAQVLFTARVQTQSYNQVFTPYLDGQCTKEVKSVLLADPSSNATDMYDTFQTPGFPDASFWVSPVFENASTPTSGSGSNIWWKVLDQDPGCGVALMTAYSQQTYGRLPFAAPSGNVIMFANTPGCYYSEIPTGAQLSGSFCCGTGDCSALSGGNQALTKRGSDYIPSHNPSLDPDSNDVPSPRVSEGKLFGRRGLSSRDNTLDLNSCKINTTGDGYPSAGKQTLVADTQSCTGGACSFQISHGLTVSTSLSTSQDTTITNGAGVSVDVKTGVDFIVDAEVTVGATYSFAKSVAKSTGTTITNGTTVTVTNNLGQEPGTQAFVTFTPTYNCWTVGVDCESPNTGSFDFCQPALGPGGTGLQGDYTVVYI